MNFAVYFFMKWSLIMVAMTCVLSATGYGQPITKKTIWDWDGRPTISDIRFDATYYRLDLTLTTEPDYLHGSVTMKAHSRQDGLSQIELDLMRFLTVDSVQMNALPVPFHQTSYKVEITLNRTYDDGELFELTVFYEGVPGASGFGSFVFSSHQGVPWIWSLSEPYGARDWWPCKDHPSDKADSTDVLITCASNLKAASNGRLESVIDHGNGTRTYHWKERYPIATYLVSLVVTNFEEFTNWFHYSPVDSMPVLNYVLPEHLSDALRDMPLTIDALAILSDLFGPYPFLDEKYGHAEFGWGGAMEHQTMTSATYPFSEAMIVHELAHQWFGDMITLRTWPEIWLNEGFATYATNLYFERRYGFQAYRDAMESDMAHAKSASGTLHITDSTNINRLFDRDLVYKKGGATLHMLRHVLGDSVFFRCLRAYASHPSLRHATASTEDFRDVCEQVSGLDLDYFFEQWIYGERFPSYAFSWYSTATDTGYAATIRLSQTTGTTNPVFFTMPMDVRISASSWDTTIVVFNNQPDQTFIVGRLARRPTRIELDPGHWIMKSVTEVDSQGHPVNPYAFRLKQNFPNPFNAGTVIEYELREESDVEIEIFNVLGQKIKTLLKGRLWRGPHQVVWDGKDRDGHAVASGVYVCRLEAGRFSQSRKMLLVR